MISHVTYQTPMMTLCRLYFGSWSDAAQLLLTLMIDQQSMDAPSFDGATFSLSHAERQQAANWFASATDNYVRQQEKKSVGNDHRPFLPSCQLTQVNNLDHFSLK